MRLRTGDLLSIVNIGTGGVLVETDRRLLPGTAVGVQLTSGERAVRLEARVVRCVVHALKPAGGVKYRGALEFTAERMSTPTPPDEGSRPVFESTLLNGHR